MFAAFLKLVIPFIIVFPGIMAFQLYGDGSCRTATRPTRTLIRDLVPAGLRGVMFAALFGAVMSSLDSMLNSASTIFTMDLYRRHVRPDADARHWCGSGVGRPGSSSSLACLLAPLAGRFEGVFTYIQMIWGFISPGIVAVFLFGVMVRRAPTAAAWAGLLLGVPDLRFPALAVARGGLPQPHGDHLRAAWWWSWASSLCCAPAPSPRRSRARVRWT